MSVFASKLFKKVNLFTLAFVLAVSSLSTLGPILLSQSTSALSPVASVYDGIPSTQPSSYPSLGYQATSTKEFGDEIQLAGTARELNNVTVSLTDWACENDATRASGDPCVTTPGATFDHPITLNLYTVSGGVVGTQFATKTQTVAVPFRPSADLTNCTDDKWFDGTNCNSGFAFDVHFDFSADATALPSNLVATVAYNTQSYGVTPIGATGPYDSLNVSLATTAPTTGTDVNSDTMYWDTTYPGYTGGLLADSGWTPYHLAIRINATDLAAPTNLTPLSGTTTNDNSFDNTWDVVLGAAKYEYTADYVLGGSNQTYTDTSDSANYVVGASTVTRHNSGAPESTYSWKVRALDVYGNPGLWSAVNTVTVNQHVATTPTGLHMTFQNDATGIADGSTINITEKPGDNKLELLWDTPPASDWVASYRILSTFPDGTTGISYQGPNTNAWLTLNWNEFGQHGEGKYTYSVVAVNPNGESTASTPATLYYDTTPPTATLVSAPAVTNATTSFHVSATAHDNVGLANALFDVRTSDGTTWVSGCLSGTETLVYAGVNNTDATLSCDIDASGLVDGTSYIIRVHASDNAGYGNVNPESERTFTVDRTNPVVTVNSLIINDHTPILTGTISEATSSLKVKVSGHTYSATNNGDGTWTAQVTHYVFNGVYNVKATATDLAGNVGIDTTSGELTVDTVKPQIKNATLSDTTLNILDVNPVLTAKLKDSATNIVSAQYKIVGQTGWISLDASDESFDSQVEYINSQIDTSSLSDGSYTLKLRTFDAAGNSRIKNLYFTIDRKAPVVTLVATPSSVGNNHPVTITATIDDATSYQLYIDGVLVDPATDLLGSGYVWDTTGVSTGVHTITLTATDAAGNPKTATTEVTVDNTAPVITYSGYTQNGNVITPTFVITGQSGFSWTASANNPTGASFDGSLVSPAFTVTNNGTYNFILVAVDEFGNATIKVFSFGYTAPVVAPTPTPAVVSNVSATDATEDVLGEQSPSTTNTDATSTGDTSVAGATDTKDTTFKLFGLPWYWVLIIIAALVAAGWFIAAFLRRRNQES